jgi:hypothetical protein
MRRTLFLTLVAALLVVTYAGLEAPKAQAAGAAIVGLDYPWSCSSSGCGPLATPLGKVIYNVPNNNAMINLTYIVQGAKPSTDYSVGFDIQVPGYCPGPGTVWPSFGSISAHNCWNPSGGTGYGLYVYVVPGTLTTDADGDGALHIDLKDLTPGTYNIDFWVSPTPASGTTAYYPVAATSTLSPGGGDYQTVVIP